jgi:hypothetical protein
MNFRVTECVYCGSPLDGPGDKGGRPSRFCGEGCKIAAEAEMRRLAFLLKHFEEGAYVDRLRPCGVVRPERQKVIDEMLERFDHLAGVPTCDESEVI